MDRFRDLQKTHDGNKNILVNAFVGFNENDSLDALLKGTPVPRDVDLLSIDIDGNDYHAWAAVRELRPRLVIIEHNPTIANAVHFVQPKDPHCTQGASAAALVELGQSKAYELICATTHNLLFVDRQYYPLFHIPDNCLEVMRDDSRCPHIFVGYDGHVFLVHGDEKGGFGLEWHVIELKESKVQVLPKWLQKYPHNYSPFQNFAYRCYQAFVNPRRALSRLRDLLWAEAGRKAL